MYNIFLVYKLKNITQITFEPTERLIVVLVLSQVELKVPVQSGTPLTHYLLETHYCASIVADVWRHYKPILCLRDYFLLAKNRKMTSQSKYSIGDNKLMLGFFPLFSCWPKSWDNRHGNLANSEDLSHTPVLEVLLAFLRLETQEWFPASTRMVEKAWSHYQALVW